MSKLDSYDYMFKIVIVGESGVGKTNLISRFTKNQFTSDTAATIEIEGKLVKAQLWDTAGQERYQAVATAYYRNGLGGLLVFDLAKKSSFDNLSKWLKCMQDHMPKAKVILIGNKCDLVNKREVSQEEAQAYANQNNLKYVETSAFNSENVETAFVELVNEVYKSYSSTIGTYQKSNNTFSLNPHINEPKSESLRDKLSNCCQN